MLLCETIEGHGTRLPRAMAYHEAARLPVIEFPELFPQLIEHSRLQHQPGRFLREYETAHLVPAQHDMDRLFPGKDLFHLPLEIRDGDEIGKHKIYDNYMIIIYGIIMQRKGDRSRGAAKRPARMPLSSFRSLRYAGFCARAPGGARR